MVRIELGVEDLANTRFGISPLTETVMSLRALVDPGQHTLHLPWLGAARQRLTPDDSQLLAALVGPSRRPRDFHTNPSRALPDFLTPRPARFHERFEDQLAAVRATPTAVVQRDLLAVHAPAPVPEPLRSVMSGDDRQVRPLLAAIAAALAHHWTWSLVPSWPDMRLVLEADTTYRARQLATGGARLLFADIHPNLRWRDGALTITEMISEHTVAAAGRGLLLIPSIFATKPVPPLNPDEPPSLTYPSRGIGTLWSPARAVDPSALVDLLGSTRALLLHMLAEPLPTIEIARRLKVTPSAVSQHLKVLHAAGLLTRARDGRHVLYRHAPTGEQLVRTTSQTSSPEPNLDLIANENGEPRPPALRRSGRRRSFAYEPSRTPIPLRNG